MREGTSELIQFPAVGLQDALMQVLRDGAQKLLVQAVEAEVAAYVERHGGQRDEHGHRLAVRNGHKDERQVQTGIGPVVIRQPRVDDRRVDAEGQRIRFTSSILPPYLRRTQSLEELIPWLYLKGISTGEFSEALAALLGSGAPGLSASTVVRLKEGWQKDYEAWSKRSLADIRTTNPIESTFATVRLRTARTKGCGSRIACLTMVFRLVQCAETRWRTLNGCKLLEDVIGGIQFVDGLRKDAA